VRNVAEAEAMGEALRMVEARARVLAVDDDPSFLALLRAVVNGTRHLAVVGEAESGERAVAATPDLQPDMVVMDVSMPGLGGIRAAEMINADRPATVVVLISATHPSEIPVDASVGCPHAVIWKSVLAPALLDEVWLEHRAELPG
jgi:DNA-binding NarL/FixJ family response regulator